MFHWHRENVRKMTMNHMTDLGIDVDKGEVFYSFVVRDIVVVICTIKTKIFGTMDVLITEQVKKQYGKDFLIIIRKLSENPSYVSLDIQRMKDDQEFFDWLKTQKHKKIEFFA